MKNVCKGRQCITLLTITAALLLSGCGSGIRIIDVNTWKYKQFCSGEWRDVIAGVDMQNGVFYTLVGEGGGPGEKQEYLLRRKIDFDGNIVDIKKVPMIPKLRYSAPSAAALSPDGEKLVCHNIRTGWLSWYDFTTGQSTQITDRFDLKHALLFSINFINKNELLIFMDEEGSELKNGLLDSRNRQAKIYKINLDDGTISEWYKAVSLEDEKARYAAGKVAFWEGNSAHALYGCIKIMDVNTGTVIHSINEGDRLFTAFNFNQDGSKIVYAVDNQQKIYDLATGQSELIGTFKKEQYSVFIAFLDDDHIIYHMNHEAGSGLFIRNIHTGGVEKKIRVDVDNDFYAVDGGKKIIVPVY